MAKVTHEIKLREEFCDAVYEGHKTFEIRKNDRGYQTGDYVRFIPVCGDYSQARIQHPLKDKTYEITYILSGWGIPEGYVVFSIKEVKEQE